MNHEENIEPTSLFAGTVAIFGRRCGLGAFARMAPEEWNKYKKIQTLSASKLRARQFPE
jgi:hypothetical protein